MGKMGDTKNRILELLKQKRQTLTDISNQLNLAPSTVSQHLQEMSDAGLIRQLNDRPTKWKYYEISNGYNVAVVRNVPGFRRVMLPISIIIIGLIAMFSILYALSGDFSAASAQRVMLAPGTAVPSGVTVFAISDAPTAYNISSLYVTIANASIRSSAGKWYSIPLQTSTFNLVALDNVSAILSGVNLGSGNYTAIKLGISNVSAVLNGTATNVFLPSKTLLLVGKINISSNTTNWVNLDFNLRSSLFITRNGSIVMLPVIVLRNSNGNGLRSDQNGILIPNGPWNMRGYTRFGMNYTGKMVNNFTPPQNLSIESGPGGKLVRAGGGMPPPSIIRNSNGIWINQNGTWQATNQNETQNYTVGRPPQGGFFSFFGGLFGRMTIGR